MPKVHAILDLFSAPSLGVLTEKRNFASVTFLGRYGLCDFMLSNFSNSGIERTAILVDKYISSVRSHIQTGSAFINNTRVGGLDIIFDEFANLKPQFNNDVQFNSILCGIKRRINKDKPYRGYYWTTEDRLL